MRCALLFAVLIPSSFCLAQEPAQDATLQTLLKEVHALRIALERSNQIGPKVQIALAKMQLQEERVRNATRQLQDVHDQVARLQNKQGETADRAKEVEAHLAQITDPKERKDIDMVLRVTKSELGQLATQEQQFRAKEGDASSLLLSEQAKWNEVNDLLTSIERMLAPQP